MQQRFLIFLLLVGILSSCRKENEHPQWDIAVIGPLLKATLRFDQLLADSLVTSDGSGAQIISYDTILSTFRLDTITQVQDTSIKTVTLFPPFPATIQPNFPFVTNNNNITLGLGSLQLKKAIVESGKIRLDIRNTLHSKIYFTYTIPKALKNNIPFTAQAVVDSGSATDPKFFSQEYDFTGYDLDLTGPSGNTVNQISFNVRAVSDPNGVPFDVGPNDTIVNLTTSLLGIKPYYAQGYLGQQQNSDINTTYLNYSNTIRSGLIRLDSIKMNLDLVNSIGADAQFYINSLTAENSRQGISVNLTAPSIVQHNININRASETGNPADPVIPTTFSAQLDNTNSNVVQFMENLPDRILSDFHLKINPLGNVSGSNDFIYTDRLLDTRLKIIMPLRFAMNQLVLSDTVPFNISNTTDFDPVGNATFTLIAENGFPVDLNVQMFLLDSTNAITDSIFVPGFIPHAPVDNNYRAHGMTRSEIPIPIDAARKDRLLSVQRVGIRIRFNTPDYPQIIQMYSDYKLDLKLIADGIYSIR